MFKIDIDFFSTLVKAVALIYAKDGIIALIAVMILLSHIVALTIILFLIDQYMTYGNFALVLQLTVNGFLQHY